MLLLSLFVFLYFVFFMVQATVIGEEPGDAQYAYSERLGLDYTQEEEQSHLLNKETTSEDEDWSFMLDEGEDEGFSSVSICSSSMFIRSYFYIRKFQLYVTLVSASLLDFLFSRLSCL